jgi:plastocyanin
VDGGSDSGSDASTGGPRTHVVNVGPGDRELFQPSSLTIKVGDEVRWIFSSGGHNVVGPGGAWCSPNNTNCGSPPEEDRGATYSRTFTTAGTFNYQCDQHDDDNMKGVVIVQP